MKVIWLRKASIALNEVYDFLAKVSPRVAADLYNDILDEVERLSNSPCIASVELLLEGEAEEFRSLIVQKRYKVVYFIENEVIKIADIWDCRCNPSRLRRSFKKNK